MHITADRLLDVLRDQGLRITAPRRAVCEVIARSHTEHLTAQSIHDAAVEEFGADLDRSTVYRTLEVLEDANVVEHSHVGQGAAVYHLAGEPTHQHLLCTRCGTTVSLAADDLGAVLGEIRERTGFAADPHVALTGLCRACAGEPS